MYHRRVAMPTVANLSGFFYLAIEYITLLDTYMYSWFLNKRSSPPWLIFFTQNVSDLLKFTCLGITFSGKHL